MDLNYTIVFREACTIYCNRDESTVFTKTVPDMHLQKVAFVQYRPLAGPLKSGVFFMETVRVACLNLSKHIDSKIRYSLLENSKTALELKVYLLIISLDQEVKCTVVRIEL